MKEKSLLLIKPDAVRNKHIGHIITILEENNFHFCALKLFRFDRELAENFYAEHLGKDFYENLLNFMMSDFTVAIIVQKENAVQELRDLIGDVNPAIRKPRTIRYLYAEGITENAVHASDSVISAKREIGIIFKTEDTERRG